jgi:hypothetical protein
MCRTHGIKRELYTILVGRSEEGEDLGGGDDVKTNLT